MADKLIEIKDNETERALLISVDTGEFNAEASIEELAQLALTAGAEVEGMMVQKRPSVSVSTYVGSGRLEEICSFCENNEIDIINSERTILLGDSYSLYRPEVEGIEGWAIPLKRLLNLIFSFVPLIYFRHTPLISYLLLLQLIHLYWYLILYIV